MKTIFGFDFSINKPCCCYFVHNEYKFISWPYGLTSNIQKIYKESPIEIVSRNDVKISSKNASEKLRFEVENSKYLANLIYNSLKDIMDENSYIAFEGLSYNSKGDASIQLGGYKFILMDTLSKVVPLTNMFTYAPQTIKKVAGCSQNGKTKKDIIEAFIGQDIEFSNYISNNGGLFKTRFDNWIIHLDDIADSYFTLRTLQGNL